MDRYGNDDAPFADCLKPLLALCINVYSLMVDEIRRFRPIALKDWPLPRGYQVRLAPSWLAHWLACAGWLAG